MTATFPMQTFYRTTPLTVDTSHKLFEEDSTKNANRNNSNSSGSGLLDDSLIDHSALDSGLEMSPPMANSRRESFAVGPSLFSPKTETWDSVEMQSIPSQSGYSEAGAPSSNPFVQSQAAPFGAQGTGWPLGNGSGTCTPMPHFDGLAAQFHPNTSIFQQAEPFANPGGTLFSSLAGGPQSIPTSPQKKLESGQIRSHNDLRRGDGIRKKNARFDIPAERNLGNIDQLIAQSTDEQEIKELKQQKRLLRNRQAALDSRQRKKQHTERLEEEKKQYTAIVADMEEEVTALRRQMEIMMTENQRYKDFVEGMRLEKEEMIRAHTNETGELRKKIATMQNHISRIEDTSMGNMSGPSEFQTGFDSMGGMGMPGTWDNVSYLNDFMEPSVKREASAPTKKTELTIPSSDSEKTTQGGLIFMLFLVGAFVLSNRTAPNLSVPDDMRAASASILENVLKDHGVSATTGDINTMAPQPSGTSWDMDMTGMQMGGSGVAPSMLGDLADSLTQPTREQQAEQAFSLSAAQYNSLTSQEFLQNASDQQAAPSQGRRNLADALAEMRANSKQSAAEVYTRSLLWDQIPAQVVQNFAKMVANCKSQQNDQQQCSPTAS